MEKILITSALLYANGALHFGHLAGAYLPADIYARYQRLQGNDVLFISGSDEYGIAITLSAELANHSPKEHVDHFHALNKELFDRIGISFDHYSRTTWQEHTPLTQQFFQDLLDNGLIEPRECEQLYSPEESRFLADRYVIGECPKCGFAQARGDECQSCGASYEATDLKNPRSKLSGKTLETRRTTHWFLRLDLMKGKLHTFLEEKRWKPNVVNFISNFVSDLQPRAITRDLNWGVPLPLPNKEGKVLYVWFDAPIGYISATKEWSHERWKDYWLDPNTKLVQFIGKDNLAFHAAIFPAMVMGQNQPYKLVDELPANEFLKLEGKQFSKSDGWYIDMSDFLQRYSADQLRYYLAANAPETADSEFTWKEFQVRCNRELLGKLGNLVHRVLVFARKKTGETIPPLPTQQDPLLDTIRRLVAEAKEAYETFSTRRATRLLMEMCQEANGYFDHKKPWKEEDPTSTIAHSCEVLKYIALVAAPLIPNTAEAIFSLLGGRPGNTWEEILHSPLSGQRIREPKVLFTQVSDEQIAAELEKLSAPS